MKICSKCKRELTGNHFFNAPSNRTIDGKGGWCKECLRKYNYLKVFTYRGRLQKIRSNMVKRAKAKGYEISISLDELTTWAESNNYTELYKNWKDSNFSRDLTPTPDRIDALLPYALPNMQLLTYKDNVAKGRTEVKSNHKPIRQYKDGLRVADYTSAGAASKATGVTTSNINRVCNGIRQSAGGFQWEFI